MNPSLDTRTELEKACQYFSCRLGAIAETDALFYIGVLLCNMNAALGVFPRFTSGTGAPSDANGNDGDWYEDENTLIMYKKEGGTWVAKGQLVPA